MRYALTLLTLAALTATGCGPDDAPDAQPATGAAAHFVTAYDLSKLPDGERLRVDSREHALVTFDPAAGAIDYARVLLIGADGQPTPMPRWIEGVFGADAAPSQIPGDTLSLTLDPTAFGTLDDGALARLATGQPLIQTGEAERQGPRRAGQLGVVSQALEDQDACPCIRWETRYHTGDDGVTSSHRICVEDRCGGVRTMHSPSPHEEPYESTDARWW